MNKPKRTARKKIYVPIGYMTDNELHRCGGGSFGGLLRYLEIKPGDFGKLSPKDGSNCQYVEFVEVKRK